MNHNMARVPLESLKISSETRPGWESAAEHTLSVGDVVRCVEGQGEVVRVLGRTGDGTRLLELRLDDRTGSYFAATSNVLIKASTIEG